jgi:hypothetical protein
LSIALALGFASGVAAEQSFLGTTGTLLTPDDSVLGAGDFSAGYHGISFDGATPNVIAASIGINGSLELGIARLDPNATGAPIKTVLNGKYLALTETAYRPSLVFGAVDIAGTLNVDKDPGLYAVIGKNLTSTATSLSGTPSAPLRGYVGFGMGIYDGVFGGLTWSLGSRAKLMVEYLHGIRIIDTLDADSMLNAGVQFAVSDELSAQVALFDGTDIGFAVDFLKITP